MWLQHLVRMGTCRQVKKIWEAIEEEEEMEVEKNRRGRPRKRRNSDVEHILSRDGKNWNAAKE